MSLMQKMSDLQTKFEQIKTDNFGGDKGFKKSMGWEEVAMDNPINVAGVNTGLNRFFNQRREAANAGFMAVRNKPLRSDQVVGRDRRGRYIVKTFKIKTIYDMMRVDYPHLYDGQFSRNIQKDAPLLSATTAAYAAVHGANAFHQIIQEDNMRRLLPKVPYVRGGYRAITAAGTTSGVGVAENAAVPLTLKPTLQNIDYGIKERAYSFNVSARMEFLSMLEDDTWAEGGGAYAALRRFAQLEFNKTLNRELLTNVTDVTGSDDFESIHRLVSSYDEVTNCGDVDANDSDVYGLDRDAGTSWADAYVNHNANTDRDLTSDILKDMIQNVQPFWGGPQDGSQAGNHINKIWVTGYDTKNAIEKIYEGQNTYRNLGMRINVGLNGVQTLPMGSQAGFLVNQLYGFPLFVTDDMPATGSISDVLLLDLNHLKHGMGIPPMYFQGGFAKGTAIELDAFQDKGVYYEMGEVLATRFNTHAKGRDFQ